MFSKILGKVKQSRDYAELVHRVSKMNLTQMREFIHNKVPDLEIDEYGITEVMRRLVDEDDLTESIKHISLNRPYDIKIHGDLSSALELIGWNLDSLRKNGFWKIVDSFEGLRNNVKS